MTEPTSNIAIYLSGLNAETFDRQEDPTADEEGHLITGTVLRSEGPSTTLVPVRVRIAHGVSAQTAEAMLRKMADVIAREPSFLSAEPGSALRRLPDGGAIRKKLTPEGLEAVAEQLGDTDRKKFYEMFDRIRFQISDDDSALPPATDSPS